jgi:N6-adenosine-specific RNA methylase IME4
MYTTVLMDPPWRYKSPGWLGGASRHYPTLPTEALMEIPVDSFTTRDAHLWLWATETHLEDAFRLASHWGFARRGIWEWVKLGKKPLTEKRREEVVSKGHPVVTLGDLSYALAWPNGYYKRTTKEYMILSTRGVNLVDDSARQVRDIIFAPSGEHSQKPEAAYDLVRRYSPGSRLDVFARDNHAGFDLWGNETREVADLPSLERWGRWARDKWPERTAA